MTRDSRILNEDPTLKISRDSAPPEWSDFRVFAWRMVSSTAFSAFIFTLILANTVLIVAETDGGTKKRYGWYLDAVDIGFLGVYVFEIVVKIYVYRAKFLSSGWNALDAVIVGTSVVEFLPFLVTTSGVNSTVLRMLRIFRSIKALRALRVLRTISFLKNLQVIVATLLRSIPALSSIIVLLFLVLYTFALIGRVLYGDIYPERFGDIWLALFALFQLITLDDWFVFYEAVHADDPSIIVYLIIFIILETFIFINLFIAVIVNNLHETQRKASSRRERFRRTLERFRARRKAKRGGTMPGAGSHAGSGEGKSAKKSAAREVGYYYPSARLSHRNKQLTGYYFTLLASIESNLDHYQNQQHVLDDLVEAVASNAVS